MVGLYCIIYQTYVWGCCLHFSTVWMTHYYYKSIPMGYVLYCKILPHPYPSPSFSRCLAVVRLLGDGWGNRTGGGLAFAWRGTGMIVLPFLTVGGVHVAVNSEVATLAGGYHMGGDLAYRDALAEVGHR